MWRQWSDVTANKIKQIWNILFMAPRNKLIVNFKLTLERVCRNELATFWPASTGPWSCIVKEAIYIKQWILIRDTSCPHIQPDHSAGIWVKSQTTNARDQDPRSLSKRRSFVSANSLQSLKFDIKRKHSETAIYATISLINFHQSKQAIPAQQVI